MIHLDTSALVAALSGPGEPAERLRAMIADYQRVSLSTLVLYEWLRGPRRAEELTAQESLFPAGAAVPFGPDEAAVAADLYEAVSRPRGREIDLAIAASALTHEARLWTLNARDFADIPGLILVGG